jgi:RNA polymerase sigma-70 factor (ECF subfamily)
MVGLALVLSGSRLAAEELAQEGFLAAWRQWERIGRYEQPVAWVRRVVANQATSTVRRRLAEAKALVRLAGRWQPEVGEPSTTAAEVWSAVRALPRHQAQAVALHYLLGCSVSEIATTLDRSERTVKTYLHDARDAIGRRLGLSWEDLQ